MQTVVTAERLWDGPASTSNPLLLIEDGKINSIATRETFQLYPLAPESSIFPAPPSAPRFSTFTSTAPPATT